METKFLKVKKARNGSGIFTKKIFKEGENIFEVKGKLITCYEDDDLDETKRSNAFRFNNNHFVDPGYKMGYWINHSCKPNSRVDKTHGKLFIVALEDLRRNTEVLIDYSTILAKDDFWKMSCNCGEKNCRKVVRRFSTLDKKLKNKYTNLGIVPKYILNIR